ncbi:type II toxin-antitoxin system RelE/ParE family toxin [Leminorella grimontii]|uniref:type II toxin-antitoxin system RelE/ParE family toxin n=1 Tax=Leminorella grimontii TaxID=82981 RepID=UPI0021C2DBB9|nr:type II toxin-antitoxin system RelE/ParE family toxin [Leminorella grimontii]
MGRYVLTAEAQKDLVDIRRYTREQWGNRQSVSYLSQMQRTLQNLADAPAIGKSREDEFGLNVYSFPYSSHIIYYARHSTGIVILAVLHQSQIPASHLLHRPH